ncbi:MAG TPA: hypothetical protein VND64_03545 [Pirellulales bacterium]|nr:hypothetical protein [Pirellulales bacterium]
MNEPETTSTVISTPRRAWFRLRWPAWLLLACCGAMFTVLNVAGRSGVDPLWHYGRVTRFGWPIAFRRQVDQATVLWSPPDQTFDEAARPLALTVDALLGLLALAALVAWFERRRARRAWQVSLAELLALVLVAGGGIGYAAHDYRRQQAALERVGWCAERGFKGSPAHRVLYDVDRALPDWLWRRLPYLPGGHLKPFDRIIGIEWPYALEPRERRAAVHDLPHLTLLKIEGYSAPTPIDNQELKEICRLTGLVVLEIGSDQVTDDGLSQLAALRRLRRLGLSCPKITDAGLKYVASLQQLESLRLWGHHAWEDGFVRTGPGLTPLTRLRRLESLDLATSMETAMTPEALSIVQKLPALRSLSLSGHGVTDATLMVVAGMADLEHLSIQNPFISSAGLVPLRRLTRLRSLSVAGCSGSRDEALEAIAGLKGLTYLSLHGVVTTDIELEQLAALCGLRDLWFDRYGVPSITPSGIAKLQNAVPNCNIH